MVGSGKIGTQPTDDVAALPGSQILSDTSKTGSSGSNSGSGGDNADQSHSSGAAGLGGHGLGVVAAVGVGAATMVVWSALL